MDYRKTPQAKPWSKDLELGDLLTSRQAVAICKTRLRDFGLDLSEPINAAGDRRAVTAGPCVTLADLAGA